MVSNDSSMWGRTASKMSVIQHVSRSADTFGMILDTDLPACTTFISRLNIKWNGNMLWNVFVEIVGLSAVIWKSSELSMSCLELFLDVGEVRIFVSVIRNWMWSDTSFLFFVFEWAPFKPLAYWPEKDFFVFW